MFSWGNVRVSALDATLAGDLESTLAPLPFMVRATSGFRSWMEQGALYTKYLGGGAKAAPPGQSAHNYGAAVDFVVLARNPADNRFGPTYDYSRPEWQAVIAAIQANPALVSGASFEDPDHVELAGWQSVASQSLLPGAPVNAEPLAPAMLTPAQKKGIVYGVAFVLLLIGAMVALRPRR